MKEFFTIGEISKLFNINKKTLRYYDEIDLFKPSYVDEKNKYRYYSIDQFEELETIQYLKELGLTLKKIRYHLNDLNLQNIVNSLEYQNRITEKKIEELREIQNRINKKIYQIKDATNHDLLNHINEIYFKQRCVIQYREKISYKTVELSVRNLARASDYKVVLTYGDVGISISKEDLIRKNYDCYSSSFIFVEHGSFDKDVIKIFPEGKYLSIRYNGYHKDAPYYYKKIQDYIECNNYEIIDDSIEIQLVDPSLITHKSEMVTEIQIPVRSR